MTKEELFDWVDSLASDIEFEFKGIHGSICPISRTDISICYGDDVRDHKSIEEALDDKIFHGKCLNDIVEEIEFW